MCLLEVPFSVSEVAAILEERVPLLINMDGNTGQPCSSSFVLIVGRMENPDRRELYSYLLMMGL